MTLADDMPIWFLPQRSKLLLGALLFVFVLVPEALAQSAPPLDVVRTTDGGMMRGTIEEYTPGAAVRIRLPSGEVRTVEAARIAYAGTAEGDPARVVEPAALGPASSANASFQGSHFYAGVTVGGGFTIVSVNPNPAIYEGAFMAAIRVGLLAGRFDLQIEFAPMSFIPSLSGPGMLSLTVSAGLYVHLAGKLYWPLRIGAGLASAGPGTDLMFQSRADLIGLAFQHRHLLLEVNLPTYRFATNFDDEFAYMLSFNVSASYVF